MTRVTVQKGDDTPIDIWIEGNLGGPEAERPVLIVRRKENADTVKMVMEHLTAGLRVFVEEGISIDYLIDGQEETVPFNFGFDPCQANPYLVPKNSMTIKIS